MPARRRSRTDDVSERERDDLPPDEDAVDDADEPTAENDEDYQDEDVQDEEADDYQDEEEDDYEEERPRRRGRRLSAATAGEAGLRHIAELTSREPEGVTLVKPSDGGWTVGVEVVEDRRIPSSGDVLAMYEAELDAEGGLLSYRRLRRYRRGSGDSERG
ncbi:gas vesicle protein GvpO [Nonomuraea rhodomycinica]|uniref:gas vesicle protein GvpO n=1 Tax=Nonomuraea rhodomycinica TaxID=1712872 RepID=UPI0028AC9CF4|nr:gas vesicle protein GvpO [Nonomuraea rhodomycinica]